MPTTILPLGAGLPQGAFEAFGVYLTIVAGASASSVIHDEIFGEFMMLSGVIWLVRVCVNH